MSIEDKDKIDFISIDNETDDVVLTISDHLDWNDIQGHLISLQDKINTYLRFVESGEIYQVYPAATSRNIVFGIASKHAMPPEGTIFLDRARRLLEKTGFGLRVMQI